MIPIGLLISLGMTVAQKVGGSGASKKAKVIQALPGLIEAAGLPSGRMVLNTPEKLDLIGRYIDAKKALMNIEAEMAKAGLDLD